MLLILLLISMLLILIFRLLIPILISLMLILLISILLILLLLLMVLLISMLLLKLDIDVKQIDAGRASSRRRVRGQRLPVRRDLAGYRAHGREALLHVGQGAISGPEEDARQGIIYMYIYFLSCLVQFYF